MKKRLRIIAVNVGGKSCVAVAETTFAGLSFETATGLIKTAELNDIKVGDIIVLPSDCKISTRQSDYNGQVYNWLVLQ